MEGTIGYPETTVRVKYTPPVEVVQTDLTQLLGGVRRFSKEQEALLFSRESSEVYDLPLWIAGDASLARRPCIAIVGTRKITPQGEARTRRLARELVEAGVVVVSGLAEGVDTAAHTAAIEAGGKTVAVVGTPLDRAYPAANKHLQETIYREHLLVSRFPPGATVHKSFFPLRNRLMAAMTDATVILEAGETSGTLHQARECHLLGKWLFIANSMFNEPSLTWPTKFLQGDPNKRTRPLVTTEDVLRILPR